MTNDELEAVRARLAKATDGPWYRSGIRGRMGDLECFRVFDGNEQWFASVSADTTNGPMHARSLADAEFIAHARTDIPALLEEVKRLRGRAAPDPCEAQVPFDTPDGVTWFPAPLGSADPFDRATRAEAHAALLQTEATYWHDKHNQDRLALAASEAHAERLAGALADVQNPACLMMCPDVWPDDTDQPHTIACTNARQALSAHRGVKDEACSRPSDALDAPVEPTSSHLGNGVDQ